MASLWEGMVCRMHDIDHRQLAQGWDTYVLVGTEQTERTKMSAGFVAFDTYKTLLQDEMGKISGPRTVIAGFGAGITESLLAVTPFESIKTTMWVQRGYDIGLSELTVPIALESMTANQPTRVCEVFYTDPPSYGENEA